MINFIHKSLDEIQWSWAELARTTARDNANDSLDQFVAILKQVSVSYRGAVRCIV